MEIPCDVDAGGVRPHRVEPLTGHMLGLLQTVKAVEQLAIRAAVEHSPGLAWQALAHHPLVDSVAVAQRLLTVIEPASPRWTPPSPEGGLINTRRAKPARERQPSGAQRDCDQREEWASAITGAAL